MDISVHSWKLAAEQAKADRVAREEAASAQCATFTKILEVGCGSSWGSSSLAVEVHVCKVF